MTAEKADNTLERAPYLPASDERPVTSYLPCAPRTCTWVPSKSPAHGPVTHTARVKCMYPIPEPLESQSGSSAASSSTLCCPSSQRSKLLGRPLSQTPLVSLPP